MSNSVKISVIIPIHNANGHISRCLESLLNQTLREMEIICVLDCPTDGTDKIVINYAKQDSRIIVLQNETNLHTSQSRNRGLEIARGEYIGFHDHDDYNCDIHMYEELYRQAKLDDADMVLSDAIIRYPRGEHKDELWRIVDIDREALLISNILPMLSDINPQVLSHCVWSSIYRKDFLKQHSISFKDRRVYLDEDRLFNFEVLFNASKLSYVPKAYYVWEQSLTSISDHYPSYLASAQITRTQFYIDYIQDRGVFVRYQKTLWELLAIETKIYFEYYSKLSRADMHQLGVLMRSMQYPLLGYKYGLKIISKKRMNLIGLNIKARMA